MAGSNCIGPTAPAALGRQAAGIAAVVGLDLPDRGQQLPGEPEARPRPARRGSGRRAGCRRARAVLGCAGSPPSAAAITSTGKQQQHGRRRRAAAFTRLGGELGGVAGRPAVLGRAREHAQREALVADDEEAVPARAAEQVAALALGQPEGLGDLVDRLRGLAEQDLARGVGDDRLPELAREQVARVLGDRRQPAPALAGALCEPVEERSRRRARASTSQASSTSTQRLRGSRSRRARSRRGRGRSAAGFSRSGRPRSEKQTSCPSGRTLVGSREELARASRPRRGEPLGEPRALAAVLLELGGRGRAGAARCRSGPRRRLGAGGAVERRELAAARARPRAARRARRGRRPARRSRRASARRQLERVERDRAAGRRAAGRRRRLRRRGAGTRPRGRRRRPGRPGRGAAAPRALPGSSCRRPSGRGRRCCSCRRRSGRRRPARPSRLSP